MTEAHTLIIHGKAACLAALATPEPFKIEISKDWEEMAIARDEIEALNEQAIRLVDKNNRLRDELGAADDENSRLGSEIAAANASIAELEESRVEDGISSARIYSDYSAAKAQLTNCHVALKARDEQIQCMSVEIAAIEAATGYDISSGLSLIEHIEALNVCAAGARDGLCAELEETKARNVDLQIEIEQSHANWREARQEINTLQANIKKPRAAKVEPQAPASTHGFTVGQRVSITLPSGHVAEDGVIAALNANAAEVAIEDGARTVIVSYERIRAVME
jgi:chromosome segregation ATPase